MKLAKIAKRIAEALYSNDTIEPNDPDFGYFAFDYLGSKGFVPYDRNDYGIALVKHNKSVGKKPRIRVKVASRKITMGRARLLVKKARKLCA
jgi:hypothetical protein